MSMLQMIVLLPVIALVETQGDECQNQSGAVPCHYEAGCHYPFGSDAACVDGFCQCLNSDVYDTCTCLPSVSSCTIKLNAESPVGVPSYNGEDATTNYSCIANSVVNYDVHVLSCNEAINRGFRQHPTGRSTVDITATGESCRPIVLVLVSSEPVEWTLNIPSQIAIDAVIVISKYHSSVVHTPGRVQSVERLRCGEIPRGYGEDSGGGDTVGLLQYLVNRFGDVASFSGTYRADRWRLDLIFQGCDVQSLPTPTSSPAPNSTGTTTNSSDVLSTIPPHPEPGKNQAIACPWEDYCRHTIEEGAICVDGFCQCPHSSVYDSCSCLPSIASCTIQLNAANSVGVPRCAGGTEKVYSCVSNVNCNYDVHVLSCYEAISGGFRQHPTGPSTVDITATGQSSRPIVLVLVSYEPVEWTLNIPSQIVIDTVIVISYYTSSVSYTPGRVQSVERPSRGEIPRGYGKDSGGGDTVGLLQYLVNRFGDVTSFSGMYRTNRWRVDMTFQGCDADFLPTETCSTTSTPTSPTTSAPTSPTIFTPTSSTLTPTDASVRLCTIELNAESPVGRPSYNGEDANTIYSCTGTSTCNYDVHVLSCYEAISGGFRQHPTGRSTVDITATGQSSRPIVLVVVSYEAVEWTLNIPSQIVIDTVIVTSYYNSSVSCTPGRVRSVERPRRGEIPCGYGTNSGGGDTVGLLQYLVNRFGDVASFSGMYRTDRWRVDITFQATSTQGSSITSDAIARGVSAAVIGVTVVTVIIVVVCTKKECKSRPAQAAQHSAPEHSHSPYPRQQGVTYRVSSVQQCAQAIEPVNGESSTH